MTGFIASGREERARLATGGGRPADPALANGFFVYPTVFDGVDDSMRIAREEIFDVWITSTGCHSDLVTGLYPRTIRRAHLTARSGEVFRISISRLS